MRLFVAVRVPEEVVTALEQFIAEMSQARGMPKDVHWVKPGNFHMTLKFLGEIPEGRLEDLQEALDKAVEGHKTFNFQVKGVGVFPDWERARVLWAGIFPQTPALDALAARVDLRTMAVGFAKADRPFTPHFTLARFSTPPREELAKFMRNLQTYDFGPVKVDRVVLVRSQLSPSGAVYSDLKDFPLLPA